MRKIIVLSMITLDGVLQAPGDPEEDPTGSFKYGGWTAPYVDDFVGRTMGEQMSGSSDLLLGRKTFEIFASYWPHPEDGWPGINKATKYAVSNTLTRHEWRNSVFLKGNVVDEIKKLKGQEGPDLHVYGSGKLIQTLLKQDVVDEFWLRIFPVTLGPDKRLFAEGTLPVAFSLQEAKTSPSGVIVATFKHAGEVETGSF